MAPGGPASFRGDVAVSSNVTVGGNLTVAGTFSASGIDADMLDTLDSAQFLRSDQSDSMTGTLTATAFSGDGAALANVDAQTIGGILPADLVRTSGNHVMAGTLTSAGFIGNGAALTNLNGDAIATGTVDPAVIDPLMATDAEVLAASSALQTQIDALEGATEFTVNSAMSALDIQNVLTAAGASPPSAVFFKSGSYAVDLTIPSGVDLVAESGFLSYSTTLSGALSYSGAGRAAVIGFQIGGSGSPRIQVSGAGTLEVFQSSVARGDAGAVATVTGSAQLIFNDSVLTASGGVGGVAVATADMTSRFSAYRTNLRAIGAGRAALASGDARLWLFGPTSVDGYVEIQNTASASISEVTINSAATSPVVTSSTDAVTLTLVGLNTGAAFGVANGPGSPVAYSMLGFPPAFAGAAIQVPAASALLPGGPASFVGSVTASQNLVAGGDLQSGAGQAFKLRSGKTATISNPGVAPAGSILQTINFGYAFAAEPVVQVTLQDVGGSLPSGVTLLDMTIENVTTSTFDVRLRNNGGASTSAVEVRVNWTAIGN